MGTPALLSIVEQNGEAVMHFARHYDGDASHVLPNLAPVLERIRAIGPRDSYGLRLADVAALVAWVGVEEERAYAADRESLGLPRSGKLTTWRPVSDNHAFSAYFCHAYTLDLNTLALTQDY